MIAKLFRRAPQGGNGPARNILIASEGRPISDAVIALATDMLDPGGTVTVLTVARLWGTSFGLPNPGLRPSKAEMQVQKDIMYSALDRLEQAGIEADGHIVTTRHPSKSIRKQVAQRGCDTIIMGADARKPWFLRATMWSQEPYRVSAGAPVPVHLVGPETPGAPPPRPGKRPAMARARP
ncbi:universal stress protein [Roseovarius dicentrarchi]|uniref:universal stress protein n=1 Tax=Roseovarius dicentrarchi TaxID=2250573 RepID=UPI000DE8469F|nr:universal stress protein [Roseovarius dicentrarchi]